MKNAVIKKPVRVAMPMEGAKNLAVNLIPSSVKEIMISMISHMM